MQGVKLTAPQGNCSLAEGAGACAERLVGTWLLVSNDSLADMEGSEEMKSYMATMNMLNDTGERASGVERGAERALAHVSSRGGIRIAVPNGLCPTRLPPPSTGVDAQELRDAGLWMAFSAADGGFCNMVTPFDIYPEGDSYSGATLNNGTGDGGRGKRAAVARGTASVLCLTPPLHLPPLLPNCSPHRLRAGRDGRPGLHRRVRRPGRRAGRVGHHRRRGRRRGVSGAQRQLGHAGTVW